MGVVACEGHHFFYLCHKRLLNISKLRIFSHTTNYIYQLKAVPLHPDMSPWRQNEVCTNVYRLTETLFTNN